MKAIETRYKGYRFRSRLEARWAVFFDALGLKWEYEPEGFELASGRYLPDFRVHYPGRSRLDEAHRIWFEVKPDATRIDAHDWARLKEFDAHSGGIVILDGPPEVKLYRQPSQEEPEGGWLLWCDKGRMWWETCEQDIPADFVPALDRACSAARGARFEHGETGNRR